MKLPVKKVRKPWEKPSVSVDISGKYLNLGKIDPVAGNLLLGFALHYASLGLPVFPVHSMVERKGNWRCSCRSGLDCPAPGKHPRTQIGLKEATTLRHLIHDWWGKYPDANIGLVTGKKAGFFVVDIDVKYGGDDAFEDLQEYYKAEYGEDYEPLPKTLIANTGSGGQHIFFKYPTDVPIKGSVWGIAQGVDIRSDGNYIVAPPSNHKSGGNYSWVWSDTEIEDAPDWLIAEILEADGSAQSDEFTTSKRSGAITGEIVEERRNEFLFKHGCGLVNSFPPEFVSKRLRELNEGLCSPPLEEKEMVRLISGIERNYRFKKS
jgi:putative DNA primase/helicase